MKKNILLVEYCTATIDIVKELLHHEVFDITIAKTEETATDLIGKMHFDMLITETLLPKSHGFILSQEVSKNSPDTKIIIISEKLKKVDYKQEAQKYGASDFFEKPLKHREFVDRVFELLEITEEDVEDEIGMTTNIHVLPLLEELQAEKHKNDAAKSVQKDVFGDIRDEVTQKDNTFTIDLD